METKKKKFDFDEDTYHIKFNFSGNDMKEYQLTIHANYQNDDYIALDEVTDDIKRDEVVEFFRHTDDVYRTIEEDVRPILVEICKFTKMLMEKKYSMINDGNTSPVRVIR